MTRFTIGCAAVIGVLGFAGCSGFGDAMTAHTDVVARAGGHELTVDEAAAFFELDDRLRPESDAVGAVADVWTDFVLLATVASDSSRLESLDMSAVAEPQVQQGLVMQLRDEVVDIDTAVTEAELREIYETDQPNLEVRARHILLRTPDSVSEAQRDSLRTLAQELRRRAASGEDFAALAGEYSEDPGSANQGGDLGYFGRGRMVAPFEDAAFALEAGGVSDVVETPFGYHIIKVIDRRMPDFDEVKDQFRQEYQSRQIGEAEQAYVRDVTESRTITVQDGAHDVARELAQDADAELSARARGRTLVAYEGGEVTAGEFLDLMRRFPRPQRMRYTEAPDEQVALVLEGLARNEILVAEAESRFPDYVEEYGDSIETAQREQLARMAESVGFDQIEPQEGETRTDAVERAATDVLTALIRGERGMIPLGPMSYVLRDELGAEIFERNFAAVAERVRQSAEQTDTAAAGPAAPTDSAQTGS